jgi:hypothetical protein
MFLAKVDTNGNMLSYKLIPNFKNEEMFSNMSLINTNKFIFTSYNFTFPDDSNYTRILILDSTGTIKKEKFVWSINGGDNIIRCIQPLSNGNILFTGDANYRISYPIGQGPIDIWVVMSDSALNFPDSLIGIKKISSEIPRAYKLLQNYPNPFNPITIIKYDIPKESLVNIKIFDLLGKEIYSANEYRLSGRYEMSFDGSKYASGVYFYRIEARQAGSSTGDFVAVKKMVLIK